MEKDLFLTLSLSTPWLLLPILIYCNKSRKRQPKDVILEKFTDSAIHEHSDSSELFPSTGLLPETLIEGNSKIDSEKAKEEDKIPSKPNQSQEFEFEDKEAEIIYREEYRQLLEKLIGEVQEMRACI